MPLSPGAGACRGTPRSHRGGGRRDRGTHLCRTDPMSTDAIVLLKKDHQEIKKVFRDFQAAGENADKTKARLVAKMIELLTVHTYLENEVMYPRVRALLPELEDDVLESYEEHH